MTGARAVLIEFGTSRWRVTPEAAALVGDVTRDTTVSDKSDPNYNTAHQPLESMRAVTDRLQVSTGRVLLHELFYLYAKMDVIQSLVRGASPLYHLFSALSNIVSTFRNGDILCVDLSIQLSECMML